MGQRADAAGQAAAFALVVIGCLTTAVVRPRKGPLDPSQFVR